MLAFSILLNILGFLVFLFLFWRRLKEDYPAEIVFSSGAIILVSGAFLRFASVAAFPQGWFWGFVFGSFCGLLIAKYKYNLRFYETLEVCIISFLPWLAFIFLADSVMIASWSSFVGFVVVMCLVLLFLFLDSRYRQFSWYASGRLGFSGLSTLGIFFLLRAAVALAFPSVLSFLQKGEVYLSGSFALICFLLVFNLARKV